MKLSDAIALKDEVTIGVIVHSFPDEQQEAIRTKIRDAFEKGATAFERDVLPALIGADGVQRFKEALPKNIIA